MTLKYCNDVGRKCKHSEFEARHFIKEIIFSGKNIGPCNTRSLMGLAQKVTAGFCDATCCSLPPQRVSDHLLSPTDTLPLTILMNSIQVTQGELSLRVRNPEAEYTRRTQHPSAETSEFDGHVPAPSPAAISQPLHRPGRTDLPHSGSICQIISSSLTSQ